MDEVDNSEAVTNGHVSSGYCFDCHHHLIDIGQTSCPECGRWFNPSDNRTFYGRQPTRMALLMMRPAGWASAVFGLVCALFILYTYSVPGGYFTLSLLVIIAVPVLYIALMADMIVSMVVSWRMGRPWLLEVQPSGNRRAMRKSQLRWLIPPVFLVGALLIAATGVPVRVSFWASQSALLDLIEGRKATTLPGYVGWIPVRSVDGDTVWLSEGGGLLDQVGFAYLPDIQGEVIERTDGVHGWRYSGDWFLVESDF